MTQSKIEMNIIRILGMDYKINYVDTRKQNGEETVGITLSVAGISLKVQNLVCREKVLNGLIVGATI